MFTLIFIRCVVTVNLFTIIHAQSVTSPAKFGSSEQVDSLFLEKNMTEHNKLSNKTETLMEINTVKETKQDRISHGQKSTKGNTPMGHQSIVTQQNRLVPSRILTTNSAYFPDSNWERIPQYNDDVAESTTPMSGLVGQEVERLATAGNDSAEDFLSAKNHTATMSLRLTVLKGDSPTVYLKRPNVHAAVKDHFINNYSNNYSKSNYIYDFSSFPEGGTKFSKIFYDNITDNLLSKRDMHMISDKIDTEVLSKYNMTAHQKVSVGINVLPGTEENKTVIPDESHSLPIPAALHQNEMSTGALPIKTVPIFHWEISDEMVCQVHRCEPENYYTKLSNSQDNYFEAQNSKFNMEIDFFVGTDIVKDIWNNHINKERHVPLDVIDIHEEVNEKKEVTRKIDDNTLHKLGLGKYRDPAMTPPPIVQNRANDIFNTPNKHQLHQADNIGLVDMQRNPSNYVFDSGVPNTNRDYMQSHVTNFILPESIPGYKNPNAFSTYERSHKNGVYPLSNRPKPLHYEYDPLFVDIGRSKHKLVPIIRDTLMPPDAIFPHIKTLSTKLGTPDPMQPPVSHLLPPSLLPSIHEDAEEGKIVQSGSTTRIILRLKPSTAHPDGEVLSLPASKFNQFGTADLKLDTGHKIRVRIKQSKQTDTSDVTTDISSHLMNFIDVSETTPRPENLTVESEIPVTVFRDGNTGEPMFMTIPGQTPAQQITTTNSQKQLNPSVPPTVPVAQPVRPVQFPNPINTAGPNINVAVDNSFTGMIGQSVNDMRMQIRDGFRNFMRQMDGLSSTVQGNVVQSFDSSVDFLRIFYENTLPENYLDDTITVMSMAAFLAFLGARMSDISTGLAVTSIGKRALDEANSVFGAESIDKFLKMLEIINFSKGKTSHETLSAKSDDGQNYIQQQRIVHDSPYEEMEEMAQLLNANIEAILKAEKESLSCLQKKLCEFSTEGYEKGGLSAFLTPIIR